MRVRLWPWTACLWTVVLSVLGIAVFSPSTPVPELIRDLGLVFIGWLLYANLDRRHEPMPRTGNSACPMDTLAEEEATAQPPASAQPRLDEEDQQRWRQAMPVSPHEALVIAGELCPALRFALSAQLELDPITGVQLATLRPLYGCSEVLVAGADWNDVLAALARKDGAEILLVAEAGNAFLRAATDHYLRIQRAEQRARDALERVPRWCDPPTEGAA